MKLFIWSIKMSNLYQLKKHSVLFAVLVCGFSLVLTNSAFNILLPNLIDIYDIPITLGGWMITIYLLAMTITMPLTAFIVDRVGKKTTYILGVGLYFLFSLVGGLFYQYFQVILIVRFMHGVAAGLIIPLSLVLLFDIYSKEVRGKVTGVWGMLLTVAPAIGPTFGGIIIQIGALQHIFWLNVPFAILSLILCFRQFHKDQPAKRKHIRPKAILLLVFSITGISLGIHMTTSSTFPKWGTIIFIFLGIVSFVRFIQKESLQEEPFIRYSLLRNPIYAISVIMTAVQASVMFGVIFIFPLMFQEVFHLTPSITGTMFIPTAIFSSLFVWIGGSFIDSGKSFNFIAYGIVLISISVLIFAFIPNNVSLVVIAVLMAIRGIGMGLSNMTVTTIGFNSLNDKDLPEASALSNTIKRLFSSFTVMLLSVYYEIRWKILWESGEVVQKAKWIALKEECLALGSLMLLTLPLALLITRRKLVVGVENENY